MWSATKCRVYQEILAGQHYSSKKDSAWFDPKPRLQHKTHKANWRQRRAPGRRQSKTAPDQRANEPASSIEHKSNWCNARRFTNSNGATSAKRICPSNASLIQSVSCQPSTNVRRSDCQSKLCVISRARMSVEAIASRSCASSAERECPSKRSPVEAVSRQQSTISGATRSPARSAVVACALRATGVLRAIL
jgi:hypothetical protein